MYVQHELTKGLLISNDDHCGAFPKGSNEHFQDQ